MKKLIQALETVSIQYETYFKLIIATGMRRGECCALKWEDINYAERSIHVCRNAVKTTGDEIIVKAPKTKAGNRYVYFSAEMESLLREYEAFCAAETERYDRREQTKDDYVFRRKGMKLPMTPSTFTWRFKKILKANDLPTVLNVHSLRHTAASLFIASGTDVGTVAGFLDTANHLPRWISTPTRLIRTRKLPARLCKVVWKSKLSPKKLYPVALCFKS
ncbi:MAG: site-specific integrase [Oscillospiraceae bacterium]